MPKIVIVYDSKTGNTEKMAKAVEEGAKTVKGVETELYKAGTRFPISALDRADAVIVGSPSRYGFPTTEMREFLDAAIELSKNHTLHLKGKLGGVFGSYGWDGGNVVYRLAQAIITLGIDVVPPMISAVDRAGLMGVHIDEEDLQECRELGKTLAEKLVKA
jgi:NAD(P)H dehydrogenase (quinone)